MCRRLSGPLGKGQSFTVHGDGRQLRDFVHVDDVVNALLLLGRHAGSGIWNVSAGKSTTILELARAVDRELIRCRREGELRRRLLYHLTGRGHGSGLNG